MNEKIFSIGGFSIKIIFDCQAGENIPLISSSWYKFMLKPFLVNRTDKIDFSIRFVDQIKDKDIFLKHGESVYMKLFSLIKNDEVITYPTINVYQFEKIIARILSHLSNRYKQIFFLHASSVCIGQKAYLFLGDNGSGKSTLIQLLKRKFIPLSDDRCLVRKEAEKYYLYQLPFIEKNNYKKIASKYQIRKLFMIKKADKFSVDKLNFYKNKNSIIYQFINQIINKTTKKNVSSFVNYFDNDIYNLYFSNEDKFIVKKMQNLLTKLG